MSRQGIAGDDDIVDYAVEFDTVIVERTQVKSSGDPENNPLYPGEADVDRHSG